MTSKTIERHHVLRASTTIDAPKSDVWAMLADFDNVAAWAPGVTESHGIAKKDLGVGHGRHCEIEGFGGIDEIITQWQQQESFAYSFSPVGPLKDGESHWTLTDLGNGKTRLQLALTFNLRFGLLGQLMYSLMVRRKLSQSLPKTAEAAKRQIEASRAMPTAGALQAG